MGTFHAVLANMAMRLPDGSPLQTLYYVASNQSPLLFKGLPSPQSPGVRGCAHTICEIAVPRVSALLALRMVVLHSFYFVSEYRDASV